MNGLDIRTELVEYNDEEKMEMPEKLYNCGRNLGY